MLTVGHISEYFRALHFDGEGHRYKVNGNELPSVSGMIKKVAPEFNREEIAERKARKLGIPVQALYDEWDNIAKEACDRGHRVHDFGEAYVYDPTLEPSCGQERAIVKFWKEVPPHIVPVALEIRMYHKLFGYAGTADIVLYNKMDGTYIIADYKTNRDLFKNFKGQTLKYPFNNMLATPFSKYTIQLSYYQLLLEQMGIKVSARKLIWLRTNGEYEMFDLEDKSPTLRHELLSRN